MHAEFHASRCALAGWASFYDAVGDGRFEKLKSGSGGEKEQVSLKLNRQLESRPSGSFVVASY